VSDAPRITVAIPTMNGARHVAETVRGILTQQGAPFDWIVSDDRSDDETLAIIRSLAGDRARIVPNSERLGLAGNWNQCVALTQTPLVAIVHQDDVWRSGHLAWHVRAFENLDVGLVASGSYTIDESGAEVSAAVVNRGGLGPVDRTLAAGEGLKAMAAGNPLRCSAVSIRVAAHREVGGFNPALRYVVDWDFWLRVAEKWALTWLAEPTVDVRWHVASETHRFATGTVDLEETESVLRRFGQSTGKRGLSRAYLNRAYAAVKGGDGLLARRCLARSLRLWPGIAGVIAADPRLAMLMAGAAIAPERAGRWFGRPRDDG
jgi:glycosyltransferase involved in cell wall biosynthesis